MKPGGRTWVGIDAALTRDTTAVVAVQLRPDGRMHAKARIWTPTGGGDGADVSGQLYV